MLEKTIRRTVAEAMKDRLASGMYDVDDTCYYPGSELLERYGRRIVNGEQYLRFATEKEAEEYFEEIAFPGETDPLIYASSRDKFTVEWYLDEAECATYEGACVTVASWIVKNGEFPTRIWYYKNSYSPKQCYADIDKYLEDDDERGFVRLTAEARVVEALARAVEDTDGEEQ